VSFEDLLRAKEEYEKNPKRVRPRMFQDEREQLQARPKTRAISGHLDKQGHCHCRGDQGCVAYICDVCGRQVPYNALMDFKRTEKGYLTKFGWKMCKCGAKKWMHLCEAGIVKKQL
jgi:hypothetical protein